MNKNKPNAQLEEAVRTINDLTMRLGQKDLALGRIESAANQLMTVLQTKDDEIHNLKLSVEKLKKAKNEKKKSAS